MPDRDTTITPTPTDDEAAAIVAALAAHLAAHCPAPAPPAPPATSRWALAGRLASHRAWDGDGVRRKA